MVSFTSSQAPSFDILAEMRSFTEHASKALAEDTADSISFSLIDRARVWTPGRHCSLERCQQVGNTFSRMAGASLSSDVTSIRKRVTTLIGIGRNWLEVHSSSSTSPLSSSTASQSSSSSSSIRSPVPSAFELMGKRTVVASDEHAIFLERIANEHDQIDKWMMDSELGIERARQEMISLNRSDFITMDIEDLSQIPIPEDVNQYIAITSRAKRVGEFLFWLKAEISQGRIGLHVCADERVPLGARVTQDPPHPASLVSGVPAHLPEEVSEATPRLEVANMHPAAIENPLLPSPAEMSLHPYVAKKRFPITVDYQLVAQQLGTPHAVCNSVVFRTEFGRHRAWGLSGFATREKLEKEGAYIKPQEKLEEKESADKKNADKQKRDRLTLGCTVYRIKGFGLESLSNRL